MKNFISLLLVTVGLSVAPKAHSAEWLTNSATSFVQFTNSCNNATNTATTGTPFVLEQGTGVTIYFSTLSAGNGTSNCFARFNYKGKNGIDTTTYPLGITNTLGGSNVLVTSSTQLTAAQTLNLYSLSFEQLGTSQTNAVTATLYFEYWR